MAKMLVKEGVKIDSDCRKEVSQRYGFKHTKFYNWIEKNGFFFFLEDASYGNHDKNVLYFKPSFCDKIWRLAFNNGGENMSRGSSADSTSLFYSPSIALGQWNTPKTDYHRAVEGTSMDYWLEVFSQVDQTINRFLEIYPSADNFLPEIKNRDNLLMYIFCLIHRGQFQEAKKKIKELRKSKLSSNELFWTYHSKRSTCRKLRRMLFFNSLFHRDQKAIEVLHNWAIKIPIVKKYIPSFKPYTEPLFTIKQYRTFYKKCEDIIGWSIIGSMGIFVFVAIILAFTK